MKKTLTLKFGNIKKIGISGLWQNNQALVAMLGLCPLLAVSTSFSNALGMGLSTLFVVTFSNLFIAIISPLINDSIRIPVFVLIIAGLVSIVELLLQTFSYSLYQTLGIFIPLIITNCLILARAESFATRNSIIHSFLDGLMMGLGFAIVLLVIGSIREIIGQGSLFDGLHLIFGFEKDMTIHFFDRDYAAILFILPPGAFLILGLLVGLKNTIEKK